MPNFSYFNLELSAVFAYLVWTCIRAIGVTSRSQQSRISLVKYTRRPRRGRRSIVLGRGIN